jgi:hypothetical protein
MMGQFSPFSFGFDLKFRDDDDVFIVLQVTPVFTLTHSFFPHRNQGHRGFPGVFKFGIGYSASTYIFMSSTILALISKYAYQLIAFH